MPHEIRVPRLGWSMEEGTFVGWRKRPGEPVAAGEILFELEGEKALQEIESLDAGILHVPDDSPAPGSVVPVGHLLGYLLVPGEPVPGPSETTAKAPAESPGSTALPESRPAVAVDVAESRPLASTIASPRARRVAAELGVDWTVVRGTGQGGRVRERDVRAAADVAAPAGTSSPRSTPASGPRLVRVSPRRKAIADRLRLSRERTIPVTITTVADATNLRGLREQFKARGATIIPSLTDIMVCLVAGTFRSHPHMAARWQDDHESLLQAAEDGLHVGIAVDTPEGLLVPVIRDAGRKSVIEVATASRALIDQARTGRLAADAMQGGVFTITNLGGFGIDAFTPIINYPEIAILGLGAIHRHPVPCPAGRTLPSDHMVLSLTFDHAAVDGAPAAAFLKDLSAAVANVAACLIAR
ncbi:dihydrolipoamide acetyltransferase family protein [Aquisphaera insulae]|uniref:dihydrolipoamide acetyltransferase family protein n=1 Tax=Aquisphaera insulae TaxID=2712864 RepID=UPI0013EB1B7D|nr:dihydrolipoamide acetyltransferase family protein [Aquisphaera insulae]